MMPRAQSAPWRRDRIVDDQVKTARWHRATGDDVDVFVGERAANPASAPGLLGRRRVSSVRITMDQGIMAGLNASDPDSPVELPNADFRFRWSGSRRGP